MTSQIVVKNAHTIGSISKRARNRLLRQVAPSMAQRLPNFSRQQLKRPIFLIGCHRSGTTLLGRLLDMHRDVANWTEANEIWDPHWFPWHEGNLTTRPPLEYDPQRFINRWWQQNEGRMDEIRAAFGAYQFLHRKSFFMNKSPYNVFRLPQLRAHFPHARFVYIIRDGRAVVDSHVRKTLVEGHLREWPRAERERFQASTAALAEQLACYWKESVEEVAKQKVALQLEEQKLIYTTTYERLCTDYITVLNEICAFLGLAPDRFLPGFHEQDVHSMNHKWRQKLDDEALSRIMAAMQPTLSQYHYGVD